MTAEEQAVAFVDGLTKPERLEWLGALPYSCIPERADLWIFLAYAIEQGWTPPSEPRTDETIHKETE